MQEGATAAAADPVDRVVRDQGAGHGREHHQRQGRAAVVGEEAPGEEHDIAGGGQTEVVERGPDQDHEVSVREEQVRDEAEQA